MALVVPVEAMVVVTRVLLISLAPAVIVVPVVLAMLFVALGLGPLAVLLLSGQEMVVELLVC